MTAPTSKSTASLTAKKKLVAGLPTSLSLLRHTAKPIEKTIRPMMLRLLTILPDAKILVVYGNGAGKRSGELLVRSCDTIKMGYVSRSLDFIF